MSAHALTLAGGGQGRRARTRREIVWGRFLSSRLTVVGALLMLGLIGLALFGPALAPRDPIAINTPDRLQAPSLAHFFGTDEFGRDLFSRVLYGARIAVRVGIISVVVAMAGGIVLGLIGGFYGGLVDTVLSRLLEVWLAFPGLLFAIAVVAMLGPSLDNVIIALGLEAVPAYARLVRGSVLSARNEQYVEAARALGARDARLMWHHILPNIIAPIIVLSSLRFGGALLAGAGLSFIGLGAQPPTPEWGAILASGRVYMRQAPWITVFPGLSIAIFVLGVNMLGDGLRDVLDPRLHD